MEVSKKKEAIQWLFDKALDQLNEDQKTEESKGPSGVTARQPKVNLKQPQCGRRVHQFQASSMLKSSTGKIQTIALQDAKLAPCFAATSSWYSNALVFCFCRLLLAIICSAHAQVPRQKRTGAAANFAIAKFHHSDMLCMNSIAPCLSSGYIILVNEII